MSAGQRFSSTSRQAALSSAALGCGAVTSLLGRSERLKRTCVFSAMKGICVNCRIAWIGWFCIVWVTSNLTSRKKSENEISSAADPSNFTSDAV